MKLPKNIQRKQSSKGFSFIELLLTVVIVVLIIVVILTLINPGKRIAQSRDAQRKSDISQIASALSAYFSQFRAYPSTYQELLNSGVMKGALHDPNPGTRYPVQALNDYYFVTGGDQTEIAVMAVLEAPDNSDRQYWVFKSACGDADTYNSQPSNTPGQETQCKFYNTCTKGGACQP